MKTVVEKELQYAFQTLHGTSLHELVGIIPTMPWFLLACRTLVLAICTNMTSFAACHAPKRTIFSGIYSIQILFRAVVGIVRLMGDHSPLLEFK